MSRRRALFLTFALAVAAHRLTPAAAATAPDPGALAHCAAISTADERLACYDSLARPTSKPSPVPSGSAPSASGKASQRPPAASGTAAASSETAPGSSADAKAFGLTKHTAPSDPGPDHIQAKVTRVDTSPLGRVRLSLDNGQAWTFSATDTLIRPGDTVTIKRGTLGSFLLTTPAHHTYRTDRLQ